MAAGVIRRLLPAPIVSKSISSSIGQRISCVLRPESGRSRRLSIIIFLAVFLTCISVAAADEDEDPISKQIDEQCPGSALWDVASLPEYYDSYVRWLLHPPLPATEPALKTELKRMFDEDQQVREELTLARGDVAGAYRREIAERMKAIGDRNDLRIKSIIRDYGFPTTQMVGSEGVLNAWLLVQHCDSDPAFQANVLDQLEARVWSGDVNRGNFALLTDRVLLNQGKAQRYGTQYRKRAEMTRPAMVENPARLDQLRAEMGLSPMVVQSCVISVHFGSVALSEPWPDAEPTSKTPAK